MQPLTKKIKQVDRKPMTFWESLYLPSIFKGMAITFSHIFKKTPTVSYREEKRPFAKVFRELHVLKRDKKGGEKGKERWKEVGVGKEGKFGWRRNI